MLFLGHQTGVLYTRVSFSGPQYSTAPLLKKDPKRGPHVENYPCLGFSVPGDVCSDGHSRQTEARNAASTIAFDCLFRV